MKNDYNFFILKENHLLIECHQGITNLFDIKRTTANIIYDSNFKYAKSYILDFRNATLEMNANEIEECGNFISNKIYLSGLKKIAFLTSQPDQVFKTTLLTLNKNFNNIELQIFSTIECALLWLRIDKTQGTFIETQITDLNAISV